MNYHTCTCSVEFFMISLLLLIQYMYVYLQVQCLLVRSGVDCCSLYCFVSIGPLCAIRLLFNQGIFCALVNILDEEETVKNSLDENRLKSKVEK